MKMSRIGAGVRQFAIVAALMAVSLFAGACSSGEDRPAGNIAFEAASFPTELIPGQYAPITFELYTETPRKNVQVTLELIPIGDAAATTSSSTKSVRKATLAEARDLVPGTEDYEAVVGEIHGHSVSTTRENEVLTTTLNFKIPAELEAGEYLPVLRINKRTSHFDETPNQAETDEDRGDNYIKGVLPLVVEAADAPNLRIVSFKHDGVAFSLHQASTEGPREDDNPDPGVETEDEPDLRAVIVVEAQSMSISTDVEVAVEIGLDDGLGGITWTALDIIDRSVENVEGTTTVSRITFPVETESGNSFDVSLVTPEGEEDSPFLGARRGEALELVIPALIRAQLLAATEDTVVRLRARVDPDNTIAEFREATQSNDDNVQVLTLVHMTSEVSGSLPAQEGRGFQSSALADGPRLEKWARYSKIALDPDKWEDFGSRDRLSCGYYMGGTMSYETQPGSTAAAAAKFATDNAMSAWAFDRRFDFLRVQAAVDLDGRTQLHGFAEYRVTVLGQVRYADFRQFEAVNGQLPIRTLYDLGSSLTVHRNVEVQVTLWLGPVPIKMVAGANGSLGIKALATQNTGNLLHGRAGPFLDVSAYAGASLDVFFASAGVYGEMTLIKIDMSFRADLRVFTGGANASLALSGPLTMTSMRGRIFVKVTWDVLISRGSEEWDLARWKGWTKSWNWFKASKWSF